MKSLPVSKQCGCANPFSLTALLMVGGESRRLGVDKARLVLEGETLWQKQLHLLKSLRPEALWLSARVRPDWCPRDVEIVLDAAPACGPLSGIAAALSQVRTSHVVVLAVDMPQMSAEHLHKLIGLAVAGCGVVPQMAHGFEPLCAVYPAEAAPAATNALARGESSLQRLIGDLLAAQRLRAYEVAQPEFPLYRNLNTWSDLDGP